MMFYRGQKVVCVNTGRPWRGLWHRLQHAWDKLRHPYAAPKVGRVYTVANVYFTSLGEAYLELIELPDADPGFWEPGFYAEMFRPVVDRKTDIAVFTEMLTPAKQTERA